jgi:hypothetical protein
MGIKLRTVLLLPSNQMGYRAPCDEVEVIDEVTTVLKSGLNQVSEYSVLEGKATIV